MNKDSSIGPCNCPDFTLSRRKFLGGVAAATGVMAGSTAFGDAFRQVTYGAAPDSPVVVVVSLRGGADGLSMIVPTGSSDDAVLRSQRPDLYIPRDRLVGGNASWGLHPALEPLSGMWESGKFGAVHGVGMPTPNRSHFDAMELIEDADPGSAARVGWINRVIGLDPEPRPEAQLRLGGTMAPSSMIGPAPALSAYTVNNLKVPDHWLDQDAAGGIRTMWDGTKSQLAEGVSSALMAFDRLSSVADSTVDGDAYPDGDLKLVLANTAALIKANVGARMIAVDYGNWDMHISLGKAEPGQLMHDHLDHLANSLVAFFADLGSEWAERVTVVTISEFGRRVAQNGTGGGAGLDHGYGNAMMLLGGGVNGGDVRGGDWRGLDNLNDGDVALSHDYRDVLWEVIANRYPEVSGERSTIFPGMDAFKPIGIMR
jgi:uncharacterized protein (DUF1501 family)